MALLIPSPLYQYSGFGEEIRDGKSCRAKSKVSSRLSLRGRRRTRRFAQLRLSALGLVAPRGRTPISILYCWSSMRRAFALTSLGLTPSIGNKPAYDHQP